LFFLRRTIIPILSHQKIRLARLAELHEVGTRPNEFWDSSQGRASLEFYKEIYQPKWFYHTFLESGRNEGYKVSRIRELAAIVKNDSANLKRQLK
jgi:hypothetical protein